MLSLFEWFSLSSASQVRKVDALCWDLSSMHVYDSVANFVSFLWWMRSAESRLGCMFLRRWQILYMFFGGRALLALVLDACL